MFDVDRKTTQTKDVDQIDKQPMPAASQSAKTRPPLKVFDPEAAAAQPQTATQPPTYTYGDDSQTPTVAHGIGALIGGVLLISGLVAALGVFVLACHFLIWAIG